MQAPAADHCELLAVNPTLTPRACATRSAMACSRAARNSARLWPTGRATNQQPRWTKRSRWSIACSFCSSPRRAALVPMWHRDLSRCLHDRALAASATGRPGLAECGRRCRRSRDLPMRAARPATAGHGVQRPAVLAAARAACRSRRDPRCGGPRGVAVAGHAAASGRRRISYATSASSNSARCTSACSSTSRSPRARRFAFTRTSNERKATGSFYTPRSITEFLVRRTLAPLVDGRTRRPDSLACACSIQRWAAARFWWRRAAISPDAASRR